MAPLGFFSENVCTETKHLMVAQMLKNTKINVYNIILLKRVNFTRHSTNSLVLLLDFSSIIEEDIDKWQIFPKCQDAENIV